MRVLLTGAFVNVGTSTLEELIKKNYDITIFEVPTKKNLRIARKYENCSIVWGDIRKYDDVAKAVGGQEVVIHTAAIIPPLADQKPDLAYAVNVGGTGNIVKAALRQDTPPWIIFTSSIAVYGDRLNNPFIMVDDPPNPNADDYYAQQKLECERIILESELEKKMIVRLSYVYSPDKLEMDPLMFHMPLDTALEPCHTKDVGTALVNAIETPEVYGKILHIAGGPGNRITYRDYLEKMIELFGLGKKLLPEWAFKKSGFHCGYMDTEDSQRLLKYHNHNLSYYFNEVKKKVAPTRFFAKMGGALSKAIAKSALLKKSPFYSSDSQ